MKPRDSFLPGFGDNVKIDLQFSKETKKPSKNKTIKSHTISRKMTLAEIIKAKEIERINKEIEDKAKERGEQHGG